MTYADQYTDFLRDKRSFFSTPHSIKEVDELLKQKDYTFQSRNKKLIEQEFQLLFASLQREGEQREQFWFYCYYICEMLRAYHEAYGTYAKTEEYERLKRQIRQRCEPQVLKRKKLYQISFIEMLATKFANDLAELADMTLHVSKMRSKVGLLNIYRIYWAFCRLTLTSAFALARDSHLIDELNRLLGMHIDADNIIKTLEAPNGILRVFSVGFFVARFIMNAGMLLKHTLVPSENEKNMPMLERFISELWKRHADFLNDVVWGTVNGLSNFAEVFHISAPVAGWMTATFLVFDVCLLLWRRKLLEDDYLVKLAQLRSELRYWQDKIGKDGNPDCEAHCKLLTEELTELEIIWKSGGDTYLFNVAAASLLALGFSASMLLTPAILVVASYAVCTIGVAMYLSADVFGSFREAYLRLEQAEIDDIHPGIALEKYENARNEFIVTMVKNILLPGLLVATMAICWEAALILTAVYMLYELWGAYQKHSQQLPEIVTIYEEPVVEVADESSLCCAFGY